MAVVSIITPVYNAAEWLPETLACVQAQTLADWEHLLVDDGSTDESVAIIEAAAQQDARIHLLRTTKNGGPSRARNLAIESAGGRYLAFLDADDLWLPEKLARCIESIREHGHCFIYHDYRHISSNGALIGPLIQAPEVLNLETLHTKRGHGGCLSFVLDRTQISGFRFPDPCPYLHEDFCAWLSLVKSGHIGHRLAADLGRYRLSPQSRSGNKWKAAIETWRIYRHASKLPRLRAAHWWMQYAWNGFWLHRYARPR